LSLAIWPKFGALHRENMNESTDLAGVASLKVALAGHHAFGESLHDELAESGPGPLPDT
jgi:hypothetical protein